MFDEEYLWDTPQFDHSPTRPPREGVIGEQVFTEYWGKLMEDDDNLMEPPNARFAEVLCTLPNVKLSQREATVAASIVKWLGTNIGRAYLLQAEYLSKSMLSRSEAYVAAWSIENMRRSYNGRIRTLEYCLMTEDQVAGRNKSIPKLSATDLEVAEHLAQWLGKDKGQAFLRECAKELERLETEDRRRREFEHEQRIRRLTSGSRVSA